MKQGQWIKCPVCGNWMHENCTVLSKPASTVDVTVLRILKKKGGGTKSTESKMGPQRETKYNNVI